MQTISKAVKIEEACREIIDAILRGDIRSKEELNALKIKLCEKYHLPNLPANSEILRYAQEHEKNKLREFLQLKPVRTASGVTVIAVMTRPYPCPHGKCAYCPGGPDFGTPQSYIGHEPAAMRGIQCNYDPYLQVKTRIRQLEEIGHKVDKIELIVMGGTFPATPVEYQEHFIKSCLNAIAEKPSRSIKEAILNAEYSQRRITGITVETRPDCAKIEQIDRMLEYGVTRVELGVQTIYNDIYEKIERGHYVEDVVEATRALRDSGLKVCYHLMPFLPGSDYKKDLTMFIEVFNNEDFKPDMLKIYPCLVVKGTKIYEWWMRGEYKAYTDEELIQLLVEVKRRVPPWVRIMRIQRDIPAKFIEAGTKKSNLRQIVQEALRKQGLKCRCIRCREVGHVPENFVSYDNIKLVKRFYEASEGEEVFLSFEDTENDVLLAFLRLRFPSEKAHRREIKESPSVLVRELHVYGKLVRVGEEPQLYEWQHRGLGKALLQEAERIGREIFDARKILVTSGIGVRDYYFRLGYRRDGPYVSKRF